MPCSLVEVVWNIGGLLLDCVTLNPEDWTRHSHHCKNLKSNKEIDCALEKWKFLKVPFLHIEIITV